MKKPKISKPNAEETKSFLTRAFIIVIVIAFVATGLGVGIYGFWEATRQQKEDASQTTSPQSSSSCAAGMESGLEKLDTPEVYKPEGKVEKLQPTDLEEGTGAAAKTGDCLVMKYYGTLASNGEKFDGNFDTDQGFKFQLGQGQVIPGWDQGLVGMKEGGTRRLVIPADLAYGPQSTGSIPANSDLVFVVKLVRITQ